METCFRYKISLRCCHIKRLDNQAADSLSKQRVEGFMDHIQQVAPNASLLSKKPKQMLFYKPLNTVLTVTRDSGKNTAEIKDNDDLQPD